MTSRQSDDPNPNVGLDVPASEARWTGLLSPAELERLKRARFGRRIGFGARPAILVIDVQNYMVGDRPEPIELSARRFPSSCGLRGWEAMSAIRNLLDVAHERHVPVFYTRFALRRDGRDIGVYGRKRELLQTENWCIEGTFGAEISAEIAPTEADMSFVKKKPSAFWGTPLLGYLVDRKIDSVLVTGGTTSNCVRATVFDSASYNFRTMVIEECVFDRVEISHRVNLFDMDRQFADVVTLAATLEYLRALPESERERTAEL